MGLTEKDMCVNYKQNVNKVMKLMPSRQSSITTLQIIHELYHFTLQSLI